VRQHMVLVSSRTVSDLHQMLGAFAAGGACKAMVFKFILPLLHTADCLVQGLLRCS
jgi:hypothetical protein